MDKTVKIPYSLPSSNLNFVNRPRLATLAIMLTYVTLLEKNNACCLKRRDQGADTFLGEVQILAADDQPERSCSWNTHPRWSSSLRGLELKFRLLASQK